MNDLLESAIEAHGGIGSRFLDQYPTLFADHVNAFLSGG